MECFDREKLLLGTFGALSLLTGYMPSATSPMLPPMLFSIGAALFAYTNALNASNKVVFDNKTALGIASMVAVFVGQTSSRMLLSTAGWLGFAYAASTRRRLNMTKLTGRTLAFSAAALVLGGLNILPMQRVMCVVDGPGIMLLTSGMILIGAALAHK